MFRISIAWFVVVALIPWSTKLAGAQEPVAKPWRLSYTDNTQAGGGLTKVEFYETRQEAEAAKALCVLANDGSRGLDPSAALPYTNIRIDQVAPTEWQSHLADNVKEAKEAVDKAKEIKEKGLATLAKGRKLGDTLREYRKALERVMSHVKQLRSTLVSMTGTIERGTFEQINRTIEDFNQQAEDYNERVTSPRTVLQLQRENGGRIIGPREFPTIETLDTVGPDELKGTLADDGGASLLAGKKGRANFAGSEMPVQFHHDGTITFGGESNPIRGHFVESGNRVTIVTETFEYRGTIDGNTISGTRRRRGGSGQEPFSISWGTPSAAGVWRQPPAFTVGGDGRLYRMDYRITLRAGGTGVYEAWGYLPKITSNFKWKQEGDRVFFDCGPNAVGTRWYRLEGDKLIDEDDPDPKTTMTRSAR